MGIDRFAVQQRLVRLLAPRKATFVRRFRIAGHTLSIEDSVLSRTAEQVHYELRRGEYDLDVPLPPGAKILDLGAHVGLFSISMAKRHPDARIIAYEPVPANHACLLRNLERNGVRNVEAVNLAVTGDGGPIRLHWNPCNTGGAGEQARPGATETAAAKSIRLPEVLKRHGLAAVDLLKIDIEGGEHGVLAWPQLEQRVGRIVGEFHVRYGGDPVEARRLLDAVSARMPGRVRVTLGG